MVDFNGGGGIVGLDPNAWMNNQPNAVGSLTGSQIDNSIGMGAGGAGAVNQGALNDVFNNFGVKTDYYSGLGAAFGRGTGGFGGAGAPNADPFTPVTQTAPAAPNFNELQRVPVYPPKEQPKSTYNPEDPSTWDAIGWSPWSMPTTTPEQGPANPVGQVDRGPDLYNGYDPGFSAHPPATQQGNVGNPTVSNSPGGNPARDNLADIIRQGISPQAPPLVPPDNRYYTGNIYGAPGNAGQSPGMAPGMGGFNNPDFNNLNFAPPGMSAVPDVFGGSGSYGGG